MGIAIGTIAVGFICVISAYYDYRREKVNGWSKFTFIIGISDVLLGCFLLTI